MFRWGMVHDKLISNRSLTVDSASRFKSFLFSFFFFPTAKKYGSTKITQKSIGII